MLGIAAMKMMSSTSNTSIMGVTLISFVSPPLPPDENAISVSRSRRLRVTYHRAGRARLLVADEPHHAHAVLAGHVRGVHDLRVLEVLVRLEVHDLVRRARIVDALDLGLDGGLGDRLLVEIVVAVAVDAEHLIVLLVLR